MNSDTVIPLATLKEQHAALAAEIAAREAAERAGVVAAARDYVTKYGLTVSEVFPDRAGRRSKPAGTTSGPVPGSDGSQRAPVAVKYRDEAGNTWTGRGKQPTWIVAAQAAGATLESFRVSAA